MLLNKEAGLNTVMQEREKTPKHQFLKTEAKLNATGAGKQEMPKQGRKQKLPPEMHIPLTCSTHQMNALTKPCAQQVFGSTSFSPLLAHAHIKT